MPELSRLNPDRLLGARPRLVADAPFCSAPSPLPIKMAVVSDSAEFLAPPARHALASLWRDPALAWGSSAPRPFSGRVCAGPLSDIALLWNRLFEPYRLDATPQTSSASSLDLSPTAFHHLTLAEPEPWLILSLFSLPEGQGLLAFHPSPGHPAFHPRAQRSFLHAPELALDLTVTHFNFGDMGFMGRARFDAVLALEAANELAFGVQNADWDHPERSPAFRSLRSFHRAFGYPGSLDSEISFLASRSNCARRLWLLAAAASERLTLGEMARPPQSPSPQLSLAL